MMENGGALNTFWIELTEKILCLIYFNKFNKISVEFDFIFCDKNLNKKFKN